MKRKKKNKTLLLVIILAVIFGAYYFLGRTKAVDGNQPANVTLALKSIKAEKIGPEDTTPEIVTGPQSEKLPFTYTVKEPKGYEVKDLKLNFEPNNVIKLLPVTKRCFFCEARKFIIEGEIQNLTAGEWELLSDYGGKL